jgi:D-alanyl-lipoteichoic acid acyltransferase DltB (MBOAT superfamily)
VYKTSRNVVQSKQRDCLVSWQIPKWPSFDTFPLLSIVLEETSGNMKETTGTERFPVWCLTFFPSALDKIDNQANPTSDFRTGFASGRNES